MISILCASLLVIVLIANYELHHDTLYPGFLQATLWFVVILLLVLDRGLFIPISNRTFLLITAGVVLFGMGAFVASYRHVPSMGRNYVAKDTLPSKSAVITLAIVVCLGLIPYLNRVLELASTGPSTSPFINLRFNASVNLEETGGIGRVSYFLALSYVLVGVALLKRSTRRAQQSSRLLVGLSVFVAFVYGLLSSGRGQLFSLLLLVLTVPLVLRLARPARTVVTLATLSLLLFIAVGIALEKGGTVTQSFGENVATMRESFLTYFLAGVPTFSTYLDNRGPDLDFGSNSFRSVVAVLQVIGFQTNPAPLVQTYLDIPMPSNVYTVYQPYVRDFGMLGGTLIMFILGFLHGALYTKATKPSPKAFWVFLFAMSMLPLAMQAFQDMYFSLLAFWIQYSIYAVVLFVLFQTRDIPVNSESSLQTSSITENQA